MPSGHYEPSIYTLEITQPQPSLTTDNRYYRAYPGLEYAVRVGVYGGSYRYNYELTTAPSGMTINSVTGHITWSNPITSGSPHNVTAKVTDQEGSTDTVSWTITVTTTGFKFVNSATGTSGVGTIDDPYKTLQDVADNASASDFVYFRAGTYNRSDWSSASGNWTGPSVFLAYPGEAVNYNTDINGNTSQIYFIGTNHNGYVDGFDVTASNGAQRTFSFPGSRNNSMGCNCTGDGIVGVDGQNPSYFFCIGGGAYGNYQYFHDNAATSGSTCYGVLLYDTIKCVVEDSDYDGLTGNADCVGIKENNQNVEVRNNRMTDVSLFGSKVQQGGSDQKNIVWCYNYIRMTTQADPTIQIQNTLSGVGPFYAFRNTFDGEPDVRTGTINTILTTFKTNVIINSLNVVTYPDKIYYEGTDQITRTDNLVGTDADSIISATTGELQGSYRTTYYGTRGYEWGVV